MHVHMHKILIVPCYDSGDPSKVDLPGPASQIACGDNHTVVLLSSGEIYTFGKHKVTTHHRIHTNNYTVGL